MSRVITKKHKETKITYISIVSDRKVDGKWRQVAIAPFGPDTSENHAKAVAACALLEVLEAEWLEAPTTYRDALEAEVVRLVGAEPVNRLKALQGGG